MAIKSLKFNGISTKDLGLVIQAVPSFSIPEKDYEITHVPGRNGDIIIDKGTYKNITKSYNLAMIFTNEGNCVFPWSDSILANSLKNEKDFNKRAYAVAKWLLSAKGYCELEDDNEPNIYRKAMIYNSNEINNVYNQGSAFVVEFECKPQKYLLTGKQKKTFTTTTRDDFIIHNSNYNTSPHIEIYKTSNALNGITITIKGKKPYNKWTDESEETKVETLMYIKIDPEGENINSVIIDWNSKSILDANGNPLYNRVVFENSDNDVLYDFPDLPTDQYISLVIKNVDGEDAIVNGTYTPNWWSIW